ncbi:acetate permease ActP [Geomicrobium sp. JCM 19038]|nr:acetate permease ActP [Geomicrobium sp. JCM 19038]
MPVSWPEAMVNLTTVNETIGIVDGAMPFIAYIGVFVTWLTAICVLPHLLMRVFTATSAGSAKISMNLGMFYYGVLMVVSTMAVLVYIPYMDSSLLSNNHSDMWLLLAAEQFFGPLLLGFIAAGIMAAVMSSVDALLLAVSSAFAYDLYKGWYRPNATHKQILKISMIATWVIGLGVMLISLRPPDFLVILYTAAVGFMSAALFPSLVFGIWWKKATLTGAKASIFVGGITYLLAFLLFDLPYNTEILIALPLATITLFSVSFVTKPSRKVVLDRMKSYHDYSH